MLCKLFYNFCLLRSKLEKENKVSENGEDDAVPAEGGEVVFLDILDEEFDGDQGHQERHEKTDTKQIKLITRKTRGGFVEVVSGRRGHGRDSQQERELDDSLPFNLHS